MGLQWVSFSRSKEIRVQGHRLQSAVAITGTSIAENEILMYRACPEDFCEQRPPGESS